MKWLELLYEAVGPKYPTASKVGVFVLGGCLFLFAWLLLENRYRQRLLQLEQPRFKEKVESVTLRFGSNNFVYKLADLERKPATPLQLGNTHPLSVYVESGVLFVDVSVYGGPGQPTVEVKRNEFVVRPSSWDRNSNNAALEVVNENQVPVFQLVYRTGSLVEINGVFPYPGGLVLASEKGMVINPSPGNWSLPKRLFKYPSWKYPGKLDED